MGHHDIFAFYETCDHDVVLVIIGGVDSGMQYVYDAATGQLRAVFKYTIVYGGCVAGPSELVVQGCRGYTPICQNP